jgi:hypothetical protein
VLLSIKPVYNQISSRLKRAKKEPPKPPEVVPLSSSSGCGPK